MNLFVSDGNPHCVKVLAVLELTGVQCNVQHVSHEERVVPFLSRPTLPALALPSGTLLFSPNTICQYLFELRGQEASGLSNQWLEWEATELQPALQLALHQVVLQGKAAEASSALQAPLHFLNQSLSKRTAPFLTSEAVSVADIVLWAALYPVLSEPSLAQVLQGLKSVQGWFERVGALQACKAAARKVLQGRGLEALKGYLQKQPAPQSQHRDMQPCNSPPEEEEGQRVISEEELQTAAQTWSRGLEGSPAPSPRQHPV